MAFGALAVVKIVEAYIGLGAQVRSNGSVIVQAITDVPLSMTAYSGEQLEEQVLIVGAGGALAGATLERLLAAVRARTPILTLLLDGAKLDLAF